MNGRRSDRRGRTGTRPRAGGARRRAPAVAAPAFLLALAALAAPARAGEGTISGGRLDLLVYFAYDETDPAGWEPVFTEYSRLLLNATEGGLQLGTVSFTLCEDLKDRADVWVLDDFSGARAHLKGLGRNGLHVTISQLHEFTGGGVLGQFGLAHETGHYVWGVYDEYRGVVGSTPVQDPLHYCVSDTSSFCCLMDGGTTISPNNQRTEFCTRTSDGFPATSHFQGATNADGLAVRTDQEWLLGRSCWEQIERSGEGGLLEPPVQPSGVQPPHAPVTFDTSRLSGNLALALVVDTSGSMADENKLALAVQAAQAAVGLLLDQDFLTIVTFDDAPSVLVPLRVVDDLVKDDATAALETLSAGGGTAAGEALLAAADQLDKVEACKELLILLTDGISTPPLPDAPVVIDALVAQRVQAFGVALGSFPDEEPLVNLSQATGGNFVDTPKPTQLPGTVGGIVTTAGGGTPVMESSEDRVGAGAVAERAFEVGARARDLRVSLSHPPGGALALELEAPDGTLVAFEAPPGNAVAYESPTQKTLLLPAPRPGAWLARVRETAGVATPFDFLAFVESADLLVETNARAVSVAWPEPLQLEVSVTAGVPVGGAEVSGTVTRPDGSSVPVTLLDDGRAVHGDERANDGVYSTLFTRVAGDGGYAFALSVSNEQGFAASNLECGVFGLGEDGQSGTPVEPFVACARRTLLLSGQPVGPPAKSGSLAPHGALSPAEEVLLPGAPPTPVAGFALAVGRGQPLWLDRLVLDVATEEGDPLALGALSLHLDADGDGTLDRPSAPLARGALVRAGSGAELVFSAPDALALLAPGVTHRFLLTAGEALAASRTANGGLTGPGGTLRLPPLRPPSGLRRPDSLGAFGALGAFGLAGLALGLLVRRAVRGSRAGFRRPSRVGLAAGLACAAALALVPACTGEGAGGRPTGAFTVELAPAGVELRGAADDLPLATGGSPLSFSFDLR